MMEALIPLRTLTAAEPVIIAPPGATLWPSCARLRGCEIYELVGTDCAVLMTPFAWLDFAGRDVTFWPACIWSSHIMTLIVQAITKPEPPICPMAVVRWAWGHPAADELGEPPATIETVWRRFAAQERAAA